MDAISTQDLPPRDFGELPAEQKSDQTLLRGKSSSEIDEMLVDYLLHESDDKACHGRLCNLYAGWCKLKGANSTEAKELGRLCFFQVLIWNHALVARWSLVACTFMGSCEHVIQNLMYAQVDSPKVKQKAPARLDNKELRLEERDMQKREGSAAQGYTSAVRKLAKHVQGAMRDIAGTGGELDSDLIDAIERFPCNQQPKVSPSALRLHTLRRPACFTKNACAMYIFCAELFLRRSQPCFATRGPRTPLLVLTQIHELMKQFRKAMVSPLCEI